MKPVGWLLVLAALAALLVYLFDKPLWARVLESGSRVGDWLRVPRESAPTAGSGSAQKAGTSSSRSSAPAKSPSQTPGWVTRDKQSLRRLLQGLQGAGAGEASPIPAPGEIPLPVGG